LNYGIFSLYGLHILIVIWRVCSAFKSLLVILIKLHFLTEFSFLDELCRLFFITLILDLAGLLSLILWWSFVTCRLLLLNLYK